MKDRPRCRVHVEATSRARPVLALLLRFVSLERRLIVATLTEGMRAVPGVALAPQKLQARLVVGEVAQEVDQLVPGGCGWSFRGSLRFSRVVILALYAGFIQ